jgi:small-conductance mechanosensitive channel
MSLAADTQAFKAQLAASQEQADRRAAEADKRAAEAKAEADKRAVEADKRAAAEDKRAVEADKRAAEADKRVAAEDKRAVEADKRAAEADKRAAQAERDTQEMKRQLGGLGNKFGSFTEGLLLPSVDRMLTERFGVTDFVMRMKSKRGAETLELDGFGFTNGEKNIGFIVEVKSHLDSRSIDQTLSQLRRFGRFHPQYKSMTLYGIIAAVDAISETMRKAVYNAGLYLVTVDDDIAEMPAPPPSFKPFSTVV